MALIPTSLLTTTLGYGSPWAVSFWAKHAPNFENDSSEDSEVDSWLEKIHSNDLVKDDKSVAGFSPFHWFRVEQNDVALTRPGCHVHSFKIAGFRVKFWASFKVNCFRITDLLEAQTLVGGKAECCYRWRQKSKPFGVTFSFNNQYGGPSGQSLSFAGFCSMKGLRQYFYSPWVEC